MQRSYSTDLSDAEWRYLEPHVPPPSKRGRPRAHAAREILDAVFYVLKSGCPWRLLPCDFPPWETVYWWFGRWRTDGTFERLNAALPGTEKAMTLAHELAHHLLHGIPKVDIANKATREIEAEGAAFVMCAAFGLDTSRFTFAYVASYAGDHEALRAALERIQGAAKRLIEAVEDPMRGRRS